MLPLLLTARSMCCTHAWALMQPLKSQLHQKMPQYDQISSSRRSNGARLNKDTTGRVSLQPHCMAHPASSPHWLPTPPGCPAEQRSPAGVRPPVAPCSTASRNITGCPSASRSIASGSTAHVPPSSAARLELYLSFKRICIVIFGYQFPYLIIYAISTFSWIMSHIVSKRSQGDQLKWYIVNIY